MPNRKVNSYNFKWSNYCFNKPLPRFQEQMSLCTDAGYIMDKKLHVCGVIPM